MQKVKMVAQGRVQGVGFRWGVYSLALEIGGITGRVWNNDDGYSWYSCSSREF